MRSSSSGASVRVDTTDGATDARDVMLLVAVRARLPWRTEPFTCCGLHSGRTGEVITGTSWSSAHSSSCFRAVQVVFGVKTG